MSMTTLITPPPSRFGTSSKGRVQRPVLTIPIPNTVVFPTRSPDPALTCITELKPSHPNPAPPKPSKTQADSAASSLAITADMLAVGELLSTMKQTLGALGSTFQALEEQTIKLAQLGPAVGAMQQVNQLKEQFNNQYNRQTQRVEEVKALLQDVLKEQLADHLRTRVHIMIQDAVEQEVKRRVQEELRIQIPATLREQQKKQERELIEIQTDIHNSEARRHNSLIVNPNSLSASLRPLLRPFPIQSPSPAPSALLQPTIEITSPTSPSSPPFSPVVPCPPAPTPAARTHVSLPPASDSDSDDIGPETPVGPLAPSPLFPRDLAGLFALGPHAARLLVREYGLIIDAPSPLETPASAHEDLAEGGDREANLNLFMAHIGVPFKMTPAPGLPKGSSPLITTS